MKIESEYPLGQDVKALRISSGKGYKTKQEGEKMRQRTILLAVLMVVSMTFASSSAIFAQEEIIQKRKDLMRANNDAVSKAIKKAVEEKDYATIETKAKDIMGNMEKIPDLFPKGSTAEKSRAHPDIWTKNEQFRKLSVDAKKAAEALSKAAAAKNEAEVNVKVKELGNSRDGACGACHKVFRTDFRKDS
jgi:cytochrome c556